MAHKSAIFEKLDKITNLPTLPLVLQKLQNAIHDPHANAGMIAGIIENDPAMMARILSVVNSALYAGVQEITSLSQAIARMGFASINNIAMSTSVFSTYKGKGKEDFSRHDFWKHCISTGIAAKVIHDRIAGKLGKKYTTDVLHLSGLLHDIGKIIFDQFFHEEFTKCVTDCAERKIALYYVELELTATDHAQVGAWLAKRWKLADQFAEVIRWHHEPDNASEEHRTLVMLCHAANYICNSLAIGNSGDSTSPSFFPSVWRRLGIEQTDVDSIKAGIEEESKKSEILLALSN